MTKYDQFLQRNNFQYLQVLISGCQRTREARNNSCIQNVIRWKCLIVTNRCDHFLLMYLKKQYIFCFNTNKGMIKIIPLFVFYEEGGLGPGQKFNNEFHEPTHCLCRCNDCQLYQMGSSKCQGVLDPCMLIEISNWTLSRFSVQGVTIILQWWANSFGQIISHSACLNDRW